MNNRVKDEIISTVIFIQTLFKQTNKIGRKVLRDGAFFDCSMLDGLLKASGWKVLEWVYVWAGGSILPAPLSLFTLLPSYLLLIFLIFTQNCHFLREDFLEPLCPVRPLSPPYTLSSYSAFPFVAATTIVINYLVSVSLVRLLIMASNMSVNRWTLGT